MDKETLTRLKEEHKALLEKFEKLIEFIHSQRFYMIDEKQQSLLLSQKSAMEEYLRCLSERLFNF